MDWEVVRLSQGGYSRGRCSQRDRETGVASCKGGNYIAGREGDGMEEGLVESGADYRYGIRKRKKPKPIPRPLAWE